MRETLFEGSIELAGRLLRILSMKNIESVSTRRARNGIEGLKISEWVFRVHTDCETWHQVTCSPKGSYKRFM